MERNTAINIIADINAFYKQMEAKYGAKFALGTVKLTTNGCKGAFEVTEKVNGNVVLAASIPNLNITTSAATTIDARLFIGKVFTVKKTTYTVKSYDPTKPKFAFSVRTQNGADWEVSRDFVLNNCKL